MATRALVLTAMLLATAFAGCFGNEEGPGATTDAPLEEANTAAPEGRGPIVAFEETNATEEGAGGVDHHHDYWEGRERVLLFEAVAEMEPFPDNEGVRALFHLPQGKFIYEGTSQVEFMISAPKRHVCEPAATFGGKFVCTDNLDYHYGAPPAPGVDDPSGGPDGLKLRYKHASTTQWIDVGPIGWGTPLAILVTNPIQTDMPHVTASAWEFEISSPRPEDATLTFNAAVEIVRGAGDVPLWPGHPLFYTPENPSRVIVEGVTGVACDTSGCALVEDDGEVVPSRVVSYGTTTLFVWVNVTEFVANNPALAPVSWFLFHHNVTAEENLTSPFDTENYGIEKRELFWALPVDDGGMDSPYADGSKWGFELGASYKTPDASPRQLSCYAGCGEWSAKYTMTVIASMTRLPPEAYHMYCLSSDVHCGEA